MTQTALTYRTNRDLFSNHYLTDHLRDTEPWNQVDDAEVEEAYEEIRDLFEDKLDRVEDYNEAQLERNFIRPVFDILGISFEIEETVERNARRPDYGFFETDEAADAAFDRSNFYEEAIAVADAKRWGRKLDTRGEEKRDFENPSYQIHAYLQETPTTWAVLTNGQKWRLYYGPTSHRLDSYYEIDLPTLLQHVEDGGSLEDFKDFYLFFRRGAFVEDTTGSSFLDDVYEESSVFAEALGEDLQDNIYEAIRVLAEGFLDTNDELDEDDLELIHDSSLIYLYRLIFVLYAESEGRDLLPTDNPIYRESYSLNNLKQTVAENRDETQQHYQSWQTHLWDRLEELFVLIDQGSHGMGVKKENLYIPAYNGGLFRTDPGPDDSDEAQFLANYEAGDAYLAKVIDLLTRREADEGDGQVFVDYSSLDERHLGSIYEGLLEYKLEVADEPLTVEDGEYTPAGDNDNIEVSQGDVYLRTDAGERKATGSYYTPEYVVEYIVDETLGPLVEDIRLEFAGSYENFADKFAERVFDLKVLDPAMGSGHFLVNAVDYLAREIIDAQERQDQQAIEAGNEEEISEPRTEEGELRDINWARRKVAQRCIYGVDLNPLATELAKVSLWLRTLAAEQPLAFLDHHLKTGNSLAGSDIEEVLDNGDSATNDGQLTLQQSFAHTRQQALEHVMDRFQDLLSIDNETLGDIKEMEEVYDEVREDPLYRHLLAMANVHTAEEFGLNTPADAHERMAEALRDDSWEKVEDQDWFQTAQAMAEERSFFHWELEFPVAFYGNEGTRISGAGFDAVIGNPPYGMIEDEELGDYCETKYSVAEGRNEIYKFFSEEAYRLTKEDGYFGYIISNTLFTNRFDQKLRNLLLENSSLSSIVTFQDDVFDDPTVHPAIFVSRKQDPAQTNELELITGAASDVPPDEWGQRSVDQSRYLNNDYDVITVIPDANEAEIWYKMDEVCDYQLGDVAHIRQCIKTGDNDKYLETFSEEPGEPWRPVLTGKDVSRYHIDWPQRYVKYGDWLARNWQNEDFYERSKIAIRETSDRITAALDKEDRYLLSTLYSVYYKQDFNEESSLEYLLAIINSNAAQFFMHQLVFALTEGAFTKARTNHYERLPVPVDGRNDSVDRESIPDELLDSVLDEAPNKDALTKKELLIASVETIQVAKNHHDNLNLFLLDYLGNYKEGESLPDLGLFQPSSSEILDSTTEEYEKLRIGKVKTKREDNSVTIYATARYKPEDEEEFETDQWGYTETEYKKAFSLRDLSETEAALIESFVPVAVNEETGGFMEEARQSISLNERLKAIRLPDLDDINEDLQRYIELKERADELEKTIEQADQLINKIVYSLYGLTEEETKVIENAVVNDD